jgi:hypothetical protein
MMFCNFCFYNNDELYVFDIGGADQSREKFTLANQKRPRTEKLASHSNANFANIAIYGLKMSINFKLPKMEFFLFFSHF